MTFSRSFPAARATVAALLLPTAVGTGAARAQSAPMVPAPTPSLDPAPAGAGVPLADTTWVLKRLGKNPVLSFNPGSATLATRCGTVTGGYTVAVPNRLTIALDASQAQPGPVSCSKGQQKDSDKLVDQLNRTTAYDLSSNGKTLKLKGKAGNLSLARGAYDDAPAAGR